MRMIKTRHAGTFLTFAALACVTPIAASAPPPPEAFGRIPQVIDVELSPNGQLAAWGDNSGATQKVVIFDLKENRQVRTLGIDPGLKLRGITWTDDETVLFEVSLTYDFGRPRGRLHYLSEMFRTLAADVRGGPAQTLLMADQRGIIGGSVLLAARTPKPKTVTMWTLDRPAVNFREELGSRMAGDQINIWLPSVFEVDTRTGAGTLIAQGGMTTEDWLVDRSGRPIVRSDSASGVYRLVTKVEGGWREFHRQVNQGDLAIYGLTADGTAVVAVGSMGKERDVLWAIPLDGSGAKLLLEDPERDVVSVRLDPFNGDPVSARLGGAIEETRWIDTQAENKHKAIARAFEGKRTRIASRSADGTRVIVDVDGNSLPSTYYLVDFTAKKADIIGEEYPDLADKALGEQRTISYKARDGLEIPAYLTLPPGLKEEKLPLVVLPHGGPEARDHAGFDWLSQFLATRGYVVLQPQFRGSTGFGEAFRLAGYGEWGGLMQDDVTDGVKALIEQGLADPERVCIVGASYGGYAALAGAALTPELYECAASINGVTDLHDFIKHIANKSGTESDRYRYVLENIGPPTSDKVVKRSPARVAANIRVPILLIHGADDTVVPIAQADKMAKSLKKLDKPYTLVKLPGEDHWLSRSDTRIRVLMELETFLATNL